MLHFSRSFLIHLHQTLIFTNNTDTHTIMKKSLLTIIITASLLTALPGHALTDNDCQRMLRQIEERYEQWPDSDIAIRTAKRYFPILKQHTNLYWYVSACNIYIDWLFRHGKLAKSKSELERVVRVASTSSHPEVLSIAQRAQGLYMLRLGFNRRAMKFLEASLHNCRDYRSLLNPFTHSSTLLHMVNISLQTHDTERADSLISKLDEFLAWTDANGIADKRQWLHNRVSAMHATLEQQRGNLSLARQWLGKSRSYMLPDVPKRWYITYYIALRDVLGAEHRYAESLSVIDTLIAYGYDILPMRMQFLKDKAVALHKLQRGMEASDAYKRYIDESDRNDRIVVAAEMDLLRSKYQYEKTVSEKKRAENEALAAVLVAAVLMIMLAGLIVMTMSLRQKNRHLVRNLTAADEAAAERAAAASQHTDEATKRLGTACIDYMRSSGCYCDIDGGREALAAHMHVSERSAASAVSQVAGRSFKSVTNGMKLELSRQLLEHEPTLTIGAIAEKCGFGTMRTYQSLFKDRYGLSPSEYRTSIKSWAKPQRGRRADGTPKA